MRLWTTGAVGEENPIVTVDGHHFDASAFTARYDPAFFARDGITQLKDLISEGQLHEIEPDTELRIGSPIASPTAIICIGQNYAAHAAESGSAPPECPIMFFKHPNTITGPNDTVAIPKGSTKTDWEVELGVVIGARAYRLANESEAREVMAGFVLANDVSERDFQLNESGGQWSKGKIAPGFCPVGPWLVTPDELNHSNLRLKSWVNNEPRQDSSTSDMIFSVEQLLIDLSKYVQLEPGDLVLTGTPEGVALSGRFPYIAPGDVVDLEIDELGHQSQLFV